MVTSLIKDIATEKQKSQNYFRIVFKEKDWKSFYSDEDHINGVGFIWNGGLWCYETCGVPDKDGNIVGVTYKESVHTRLDYDYEKHEHVTKNYGYIYGDRVKIPSFDPVKDSWFSDYHSNVVDKPIIEPAKFSPFEIHCHTVLDGVGYDWNDVSNTDVESDNSWINKSHLAISTFIFDYAGKQLRKKYGNSVKYTCDEGEHLFYYKDESWNTIIGRGCSWEVYIPDNQDITKRDVEKLVGETGIIELLEKAYQKEFDFIVSKKTIKPRKNRLGGRPEINVDKLTDMSGVEIEAGDMIAYPYSRGKYDYGLGYAIVKEFSGKYVVHTNGKTCASKVLVIKPKNSEKILPFQTDGN